MTAATSSTENIISNEVVDAPDANNSINNNNKNNNKNKYTNPYIKFIESYGLKILVFALIWAHFIWSTIYQFKISDEPIETSYSQGYRFYVIVFIFFNYGYCYAYLLKPYILPPVERYIWKPLKTLANSIRYGSIIFYVLFLLGLGTYLIIDTWDDKKRLIPISGLIFFLLFGYGISSDRSKIPWHTVIWGLILQFLFGLLTIRWDVGRDIFDCVGDKVNTFLGYAVDGAEFVYGEVLIRDMKVFAFASLSTIFFLGFMINILYYYGIMQSVVVSIGSFLQFVMGTSICESVNSAANIFLGQTEAPLLLKPYLAHLTDSELHSVMASGFATVSGTVLAAYISFGANAAHLITASVMSAPAALCYTKLVYPETEETKATKETIEVTENEYDSVLNAAAQGAADAFKMVTGIISSLVAFIALVSFINGFLGWMGQLVGYTDENEQWTIDLFVGKLFIPISYIMGVEWDECEKVGKLIGIKTMINEFAAFKALGETQLTEKSKLIATYAVCGFANPASIGIVISGLGSLIPTKQEAITRLVFRAFVCGCIVCFMTACIAALLTPS